MKLKWHICPTCEGNGKKENPSFENGFTSAEWDDMDDEQQATYMSGGYDVRCDQCDGEGKVQLPDVDSMTAQEREEYQNDQRDLAMMYSEIESERRLGC